VTAGTTGAPAGALPAESSVMRIARFFGAERMAWSLRRLHCPVADDALVLEVGSGGNPYFRANVLLDAYESTAERHWVPLVTDRPTVLGFVEDLPFKDKAFDFIIASHVLEHSRDPVRFLAELQRVARAGYIEVPDAFMERINPYRDHRLEITVRDDKLLIRPKVGWQVDPELVELYEDRAKQVIAARVIPKHPFAFHVRFYWQGAIDYEILAPRPTAVPEPAIGGGSTMPAPLGWRGKLYRILGVAVRSLFSQGTRNANLRLVDLMRCPTCRTGDFIAKDGAFECRNCGARYATRNGVADMAVRADGAAP
jgi:SAM-dependent methyltransferase